MEGEIKEPMLLFKYMGVDPGGVANRELKQ